MTTHEEAAVSEATTAAAATTTRTTTMMNGGTVGGLTMTTATTTTTTTTSTNAHNDDNNNNNNNNNNGKSDCCDAGHDAAVAIADPIIDDDAVDKQDNEQEQDDDDEDEEKGIVVREEDEEEMQLFNSLQKQEEIVAHEHDHDQQPKQVTAAPKLLQVAIQKGQVQANDDSDDDDDDDKDNISKKKKKSETIPSVTTAKTSSAAPTTEVPVVHIHKRDNQLDFLLSKASEYSNFIAKDLEELQLSMSEQAAQQSATAALNNNNNKKRSTTTTSNGKGNNNNKKQKTTTTSNSNNNGSQLLQSAQQERDRSSSTTTTTNNTNKRPIFIQPPNLSKDCILKDYQLEGVRWLASLFENGVSGILADEMGLGKTIQCVALIAHLLTKGVSGPFLIVAPLATLPNWVREFEKWLPSHPVVRYHGPAPVREALLKGVLHPKFKKNHDFPFIVTSYEVAIRDQSKLEKLSEFTYLIVDEGHRLKNHRCLLLNSLKKLKCSNRLLLTGTPIQNTLDELWSLLNFVNPQIFDDLSVFQSWFGFKDIGQKTQGATDEETILLEERKNRTVTKLHEILRPFLLRRVKVDVLSEMPPKKEIIVYSGISKLQAGYADLIDKGTLRETLINQGIENGRTLSQTNKMMNHRKNINHPFIFGEPIDPATGIHLGSAYPQLLVRASGKFALLDRMLSRLHVDGHQVLIFSQMTRVLSVMEDYLNYRKWNYCRIDGSTDVDERQRQMDVFNAEKTNGVNGTRNSADNRCFVFLLSTRAGGLGINLTGGDTCIIFDSDWNPHADSQAMDRCHRMGQERPVAVYRLLTVNSVDIEMMEKQVSKKKLERMTIAGGDFRKAGHRSKGEINVDQLASLLQSDIKDMNAKGGDVEDIKIDDDEFDMIMDRKRLFATGSDAIPTEGKMYDVIDAAVGDLLGKMTTD